MAKKPAPHIVKFTHDNLTNALTQLTSTNQATVAALPLLWNSIMAPVAVPALTTYCFQLATGSYQATLSSYQWQSISDTINKNGDVLSTVIGLLSDLTQKISGCACGLVDTLTGAAMPFGSSQSPMGCCTFDGQQKPLTQLQCSQYTMSSWNGGDPNCTGAPDGGGK